ncbi:MAG: universal stress protein [Anaerolineales bacterium]|nr:universal stress protein [Chloroflexota bacterium]MBL6982012.1 universal stress protein [Anaerolineales bacterium]
MKNTLIPKFSRVNYQLALRDFQRARKQAVMQQILSRLRGDADKLLGFDDIRQQLHGTGESIKRGLQEIPLEKIVGSVSRYGDFTRSFLPKRDDDEERWAGVRAAVDDMVGMPPIDVYQVGDAYFVQDGNHRVSIARQLRSKTISAYVTEVPTRVPLTANDDPNDIICKSRYAAFLEKTNLDKLRPEVDLLMTFSGHYHFILNQIEAEFSILNQNKGKKDDKELWEKAVENWYDLIYLPVVRIIRELGILHHFPERTEVDMYVLLSQRQAELEKDLGWHVNLETGVTELITAEKRSRGLLSNFLRRVSPFLDRGPSPGIWRRQQLIRHRYHHLFEHILVPLDGSEEGWQMFEFILGAAQFDGDHILGLHVVSDKNLIGSDYINQMRERFNQSCQDVGIRGEFAVEVGSSPVKSILKHAAWVDFVIVNSTRPPIDQPLARVSPDLKLIIQQCPRPIQVRPNGTESDYSHALLAYDGSPKADEALFIATYLSARWKKDLTVVTVQTENTDVSVLEKAQTYLTQHGLRDVNYVLGKGAIAETVLETANTHGSNLLFMGGFSFRPVRHLTLGSTAEHILREFRHPMWVCQ